MRKQPWFAAAAIAAIALLAGTSAAADPRFVEQQAENELLGDWVIGSTVQGLDGEEVGNITDFLIDRETGVITAVLIDVGGFLGFAAKTVAVPLAEFEMTYDAHQVQLMLTRDAADAAPEFEFREREELPAPGGMGTGFAN